MRRITLPEPFTGGEVTDLPAYRLGPNFGELVQDACWPSILTSQRKGWTYEGATNGAVDLRGVYRAKFVLGDVSRTIVSYGTTIAINGGATLASSLATTFLPRAMYRDELILCAQDGVTPLRRYSGAATASDTATSDWVANTATHVATSGTWAGEAGWFLLEQRSGLPVLNLRVLERTSTTSMTIEGVRATTAPGAVSSLVRATGETFPCVVVYEAGTISVAGTTVTGAGTKWATGAWGVVSTWDSLLSLPVGADARVASVSTVTNDNTLTVDTTASSNINYRILRNCPFKDAAAHKGSFWGTGVDQYPDRVYYGPPGWNLSFPPGFVEPVDPTVAFTSSDPNDFLMEFIDVPSPFDGDSNVAILSTPGPLLVLKRKSLYAVDGSYPTVGQRLLANGAGCIDIRSAWELAGAPTWAGESGIFRWINGQPEDITDQRINREWRSLTDGFDYGTNDYCTIGEENGYLHIHITTDGGTTHRSYVYNLRSGAWSRWTNHKARFQFTSKLPGEAEKLLWVSDDEQGRVLNSAMTTNGTGIAKDADGTSPRFQGRTTSVMGRSNGTEGLTRIIDLDVHANVLDASAAGSTKLQVSVVSGGGIANEADSTKTLTAIDSDTLDRVDRHHYRVARKGRLHQVRLDADTIGTNTSTTKLEVAQIVATVRDSRSRA